MAKEPERNWEVPIMDIVKKLIEGVPTGLTNALERRIADCGDLNEASKVVGDLGRDLSHLREGNIYGPYPSLNCKYVPQMDKLIFRYTGPYSSLGAFLLEFKKIHPITRLGKTAHVSNNTLLLFVEGKLKYKSLSFKRRRAFQRVREKIFAAIQLEPLDKMAELKSMPLFEGWPSDLFD